MIWVLALIGVRNVAWQISTLALREPPTLMKETSSHSSRKAASNSESFAPTLCTLRGVQLWRPVLLMYSNPRMLLFNLNQYLLAHLLDCSLSWQMASGPWVLRFRFPSSSTPMWLGGIVCKGLLIIHSYWRGWIRNFLYKISVFTICHDIQTMHNSRVCHCLLLHECCEPTYAKLHNA